MTENSGGVALLSSSRSTTFISTTMDFRRTILDSESPCIPDLQEVARNSTGASGTNEFSKRNSGRGAQMGGRDGKFYCRIRQLWELRQVLQSIIQQNKQCGDIILAMMNNLGNINFFPRKLPRAVISDLLFYEVIKNLHNNGFNCCVRTLGALVTIIYKHFLTNSKKRLVKSYEAKSHYNNGVIIVAHFEEAKI